ncbi:hypothetical protein ACWEN6_18355 [Sphaerisporangium sp. NPDC004334]
MRAGRSMEPVRRLAPIMASGVASVFKLLIATLAFCGAYFGVAATGGPAVPARAGETAAGEQVRTVTLSAQAMPVEMGRAPRPGLVTVGAAEPGAPCPRAYHAQSFLAGGAGRAAAYEWSLRRWNPGRHAWKTVEVSGAGRVLGGPRTVEWRPRVAGAPGWYRVELAATGGRTIAGERFKVTC